MNFISRHLAPVFLFCFYVGLSQAHGAPSSHRPFETSKRQARKCSIVVNKRDNTLRLYISGQPAKRYRVATGLYKCTPEGSFRIIQKSFISRSGRGQFGTRWMGLNTLGKRGWYRIGIHGTNEPYTIGKYASKACVRMLNSQVNEVYDLAPIGTKVRIVDVPEKPRRYTPRPVTAKAFLARLFPSPHTVRNSFEWNFLQPALSQEPFGLTRWPSQTASDNSICLSIQPAYLSPLFSAVKQNRQYAVSPFSFQWRPL
jgi:hypothetical protein